MNSIVYIMALLSMNPTLSSCEQVEISNGKTTAAVHTPKTDAQSYYRGTRFDQSGVVFALESGGHSYVGPWQDSNDPFLHDRIMGPAEEFAQIGYENAKVGGEFLKIGVGVLRKSSDAPYNFREKYEVVDAGERKTQIFPDRVVFTHTLKTADGYAYEYVKTLRIGANSEFLIEHTLKNTGSKDIDTNVFNHNFFVLDKEGAGTNISLIYPFEVRGDIVDGIGTIAVFDGKKIKYLRSPVGEERALVRNIKGSGKVSDYDFRIENLKTGAGVRIRSDKPLLKSTFWSCKTTYCPEPFIDVKVPAGKEFSWTNVYDFYSAK